MPDKEAPRTTDATATPAIQPPTTETVYVYDPNDPNRPPDAVTPLESPREPLDPQPGVVPIRKPEPTQQPPKKAS